ncbi:ketosynthase chain-length factor [Nocardiopsis sp. RSe5-2]|uniref:Ketosynthase chain-length factor n=1 Tax=Nocardiopsis endophytica TaxID=3018445 RepID=A0ABT4U7Q7_9ACTN|nr:ketosynthase chain-length factor [Nocardiopsis endophytica]MDA2812992.1 ketosynthase chain-length factor [Nocardiopsis endophytica]
MTSPGAAPAADPVVTGIGAIAPNGVGTDAYWQSALSGKSGIDAVTRFDASSYPVRLAGEATGFVAEEHLPSRLIKQTDRMTHMAFTAAEWALHEAGLDPESLPEYRASVITANSSGGFEFGQRELDNLWRKGPRHVGAYQSIAWFYAATTGQLSIRHGMRGPCGVLATEQAGGLDALGRARRLLREDRIDAALTGGTDASLCPWGFVPQLAGARLSRCDDPRRAYRPFSPDAEGHVPGEGGAILVMERPEAARARGAVPYGRISGYAATFDPPPGSPRPPGLRRAAERALAEARLAPEQVDAVFADAAGDPVRDREEAEALRGLFGPRGVPVTAPKTLTGRIYAGGAPLDTAAALLAVRHGVLPPTAGVPADRPDDGLDLVLDAPRETPVRAALVLARGEGGFNAALVVRAPEEPR